MHVTLPSTKLELYMTMSYGGEETVSQTRENMAISLSQNHHHCLSYWPGSQRLCSKCRLELQLHFLQLCYTQEHQHQTAGGEGTEREREGVLQEGKSDWTSTTTCMHKHVLEEN